MYVYVYTHTYICSIFTTDFSSQYFPDYSTRMKPKQQNAVTELKKQRSEHWGADGS